MDDARTDVAARADIEAVLREHSVRVTRPRVLVYATLRALGGHRSVDDIADALADHGTPLPRMTVYNVVSNLVRAGVLMLADAGPGRALYEVNDGWHHHFVCRSCGAIHDVPCSVGSKPCLEPGDVPGSVEEAQVIFRGICNVCSNQQ